MWDHRADPRPAPARTPGTYRPAQRHRFSAELSPGGADCKLLDFLPSTGCQWVAKMGRGKHGRKRAVEGPAHTILQEECEQSRERAAEPGKPHTGKPWGDMASAAQNFMATEIHWGRGFSPHFHTSSNPTVNQGSLLHQLALVFYSSNSFTTPCSESPGGICCSENSVVLSW